MINWGKCIQYFHHLRKVLPVKSVLWISNNNSLLLCDPSFLIQNLEVTNIQTKALYMTHDEKSTVLAQDVVRAKWCSHQLYLHVDRNWMKIHYYFSFCWASTSFLILLFYCNDCSQQNSSNIVEGCLWNPESLQIYSFCTSDWLQHRPVMWDLTSAD